MEFYPNVDAVLLVYDVGNSSSFETLERWLNEMAQGMDNTSVVCVVCGNKARIPAYESVREKKWLIRFLSLNRVIEDML